MLSRLEDGALTKTVLDAIFLACESGVGERASRYHEVSSSESWCCRGNLKMQPALREDRFLTHLERYPLGSMVPPTHLRCIHVCMTDRQRKRYLVRLTVVVTAMSAQQGVDLLYIGGWSDDVIAPCLRSGLFILSSWHQGERNAQDAPVSITATL